MSYTVGDAYTPAAYCAHLDGIFTADLAAQYAGYGWADADGGFCFAAGDAGNPNHLADQFTAPVTLADGSIQFTWLSLQADPDSGAVDHVNSCRVLLQKTSDGYRVAALEPVW